MSGKDLKKELRQIGYITLGALVVWAALTAFWGWHLRTFMEEGEWATTEARILRVSVDEPPFGSKGECPSGNTDREHMIVTVTYAFDVGGKRFVSDQFSHNYRGDINCSIAEANAQKAVFEKAGSLSIYYDPEDPSRSVARRRDPVALALGGLGVVLGLAAIVAFYFTQRRRLKKKIAAG